MSLRVRCDDKSGCVAEADAPILNDVHFSSRTQIVGTAPGWTDNRGLGGEWKHFCPQHPQPEVSGG